MIVRKRIARGWHLTWLLLSFLCTIVHGAPSKAKKPDPKVVAGLKEGAGFAKAKKYSDAVSAFLKVVDLAPDEVRAHACLALVYLRMGCSLLAQEKFAYVKKRNEKLTAWLKKRDSFFNDRMARSVTKIETLSLPKDITPEKILESGSKAPPTAIRDLLKSMRQTVRGLTCHIKQSDPRFKGIKLKTLTRVGPWYLPRYEERRMSVSHPVTAYRIDQIMLGLACFSSSHFCERILSRWKGDARDRLALDSAKAYVALSLGSGKKPIIPAAMLSALKVIAKDQKNPLAGQAAKYTDPAKLEAAHEAAAKGKK